MSRSRRFFAPALPAIPRMLPSVRDERGCRSALPYAAEPTGQYLIAHCSALPHGSAAALHWRLPSVAVGAALQLPGLTLLWR